MERRRDGERIERRGGRDREGEMRVGMDESAKRGREREEERERVSERFFNNEWEGCMNKASILF